MGQVFLLLFETSWLFSANMIAVILPSQPAGCNSVSTLAVAVTSKLISLSQVSEYSDSFLLTSCTLFMPLYAYAVTLLPLCAAQ